MDFINTPYAVSATWTFKTTEEIPIASLHLAEGIVGTTTGVLLGKLAKLITKCIMKEVPKLNIGDKVKLQIISTCPLEINLSTIN